MMPDKGSDNEKGPVALLTGPATIFVALTRLSLAGLHPCRAQLRFTGQLYYSLSCTCSFKVDAGTHRADGQQIENRPLDHPCEEAGMSGTETPTHPVDLIGRHNGPIDAMAETAPPLPKNGALGCAKLNHPKTTDRAKTSQTRSPAPDADHGPRARNYAANDGVKVDAADAVTTMDTVGRAHPFTCWF
jgi:hypothetical protein